MIAIRDGRTSTETLRSDSADRAGLGHAVEYAVLDRSGRLQLPPEMTDALGMRDRVRLEAEPDHIGVWPDLSAALPIVSSAALPGSDAQPTSTDAQPGQAERADAASAQAQVRPTGDEHD
jgi:hypothetical protein